MVVRRYARRAGVTIVGLAIVAIGVVLLVLPGPGLVVVVAGLAVLATEYEWASRWLHRARMRAEQASAASTSNPVSTVLTFLCAFGLVAIGIALIVYEHLPLANLSSGVGVIIGGLALLVITTMTLRKSR